MTVTFDNGEVKGWVVIDSLTDGGAMGGVRMTPAVTEGEVARLARGMTDKLTLVGLPMGGAKAGVVHTGGDKQRILRAFGRTVAPLLHGGIHLGADLGVGPADRAVFFEAAGYDPRRRPKAVPMPYDWKTYYEPLVDVTGHGTGHAVLAALEARGEKGPRAVVVQGFGSVGRAVATFLADRGHRIVVVADEHGTVSDPIGLPVGELIAVTDAAGRVDRSRLPAAVTTDAGADAWLDVDADVLVLAAQKDAINAGNAHRLRTPLVVEGGNLCVSAEARLKLPILGVTLIPDVVANVGGAAAAGLALTSTVPFELDPGARKGWVFDWVAARVAGNTWDLLELAADKADPLGELIAARREEYRR